MRPDVHFQLILYVSGATVHSRLALENVQVVCERYLQGLFELTVVDVLADPDAAERDKILATPTLVRRRPLPVRKIIGDLSDYERVLMGLDVYRVVAEQPDGQ